MKTIALFCLGFMLLLPACSRKGLDPAAVASEIDSLMSAEFKAHDPGAVLLIAKDGVPVLRNAYGLANLELSVLATPENVFSIGSITKQFTAVCVLQLVQQGKLSLQDDIRKYLPDYNTHGRFITIEHLLTHTSGIPIKSFPPGFFDKGMLIPTHEEILHSIDNDSLLFEPGMDWSYGNFGYVLAAYIVARISGMPYREYMQKNVFEPAGMKHTSFGARDKVVPMLATAYTPAGDTLFRPEEYYDWGWVIGAGDILTTVDDMLRWDEALYTEKLVRHDLLEKAWTPYTLSDGRKTNYGYGWWISRSQGFPIITHTGGVGGFRSVAVRLPSQHLFLVILSNSARGSLAPLGTLLALKAAEKSVTTPPKRTLAPREVDEYTGVYEMHYSWVLHAKDVSRKTLYRVVSLRDSVLTMTEPGGRKTALENVGTDLFLDRKTQTYYQFHRDGTGRVSALDSYTEPVAYVPRTLEPKTTLPVPQERVRIALDEASLQPVAGTYRLGGAHLSHVHTAGSRIFMEGVGELLPETATRFFVQDADVTVQFQKDSRGAVTGLTLNRGRTYAATKIE